MAIAHQFTLGRAVIDRSDPSWMTRYARDPCGRGDDSVPSVARAAFPYPGPHEPGRQIGPGTVFL